MLAGIGGCLGTCDHEWLSLAQVRCLPRLSLISAGSAEFCGLVNILNLAPLRYTPTATRRLKAREVLPFPLGVSMAVDIAQLLAFAVKNNASDLHLSAGVPPMIRVDGDMKRINMPSL